MSKIKNSGLDPYGAEPFEQQQFRAAGIEWVKDRCVVQSFLTDRRFVLVQRVEGLEAELAEVHETNQKLTDELQSKSVAVDDRDSLQRVVRDLEEQLETLSRSEHQAQQRICQLEDELKNLKTLEEVCVSFLFVWMIACTGWLKIKYPTREYAMSLQPLDSEKCQD